MAVNLYVFLWRGGTSLPDVMQRAAVQVPDAHPGVAAPKDAIIPPAMPDLLKDPGIWKKGQVTRGDSMGTILQREGLDPNQADAIIRALRTQTDLQKMKPGQGYGLWVGSEKSVRMFSFQVSRFEKIVVMPAPGGGFTAETVREKTQTRTQIESGQIDSSLAEALTDQALANLFVDLFAFDINFYIDQHEGDRFRILVEKEYAGDTFVRYGKILAAEYDGKVGTHRAFFYRGAYYAEDGRAITRAFLKTPLKYARVSSTFNPKRMHPVLHVERGHWGVDYAAPTGTPVWAAAAGRVIHRGPRGGGGNVVTIQHGNGYTTSYLHLSKFASELALGDRVSQKDVIGYVGTTGLSTGPHLHFELKRNGQPVDPLTMKMERDAGIAPAELAAFRAHVAETVQKLGPDAALSLR